MNVRGAYAAAAGRRRSCSSRRRSRRSRRAAPPSRSRRAGAPDESACRRRAWSPRAPACQLARRSIELVDAALHLVGVRRRARAAPSISCRSTVFASPTMPTSTGIDLADLLRVDVDLDQPRRRNRERVLGPPRAAVGFAEAGADREDDVGAAHRLVGDARAPDAGHPAAPADDLPGTRPSPSASSRPASPSARRAPSARRDASESSDAVAGEDRRRLRRLRAAARRRRRRPARPPARR